MPVKTLLQCSNLRKPANFLIFVLIFLSAFLLSGYYAPALQLDSSWQVVLEYAFKNHLQFGKEIIFTYGPLGFLNTVSSQGHLIFLRVMFSLCWATVTTLSVVYFTNKLPPIIKYIFITWFMFFAYTRDIEQHLYLVMAFSFVVLMRENSFVSGVARFVFIVLLAIISLIKFNVLITVAVVISICFIVKLLQNEIKSAFLLMLTYLLSVVILWISCNQNVEHLIDWLKNGLQVSLGYNEAMNTMAQPFTILCAIIPLTIFMVRNIRLIYFFKKSPELVGFVLLITTHVFLMWKHSFVSGTTHVLHFFFIFPLLYCLMFLDDFTDTKTDCATKKVMPVAAVVFFCLVGVEFPPPGDMFPQLRSWPVRTITNIRHLSNVITGKAVRNFKVVDLNADKMVRLPMSKQLIGQEPVDVFNYLQWSALANNLNYRPRPIIQGYAAYTPGLQTKNSDFYESVRRPKFILFRMETIQNRYPTLDDSTALNFILNNYVPVYQENNFIVMKNFQNETNQFEEIYKQDIKLDEPIDLDHWNDSTLFVSVEVKYSYIGKILGLLYQKIPLYLRVTVGDQVTDYRFPPIMAKKPFLLSPIIDSNDQFIKTYEGTIDKRVQKLSLVPGSGFPAVIRALLRWQYAGPFTVTLFKSPNFMNNSIKVLRSNGISGNVAIKN